jgi:hypothetical protein
VIDPVELPAHNMPVTAVEADKAAAGWVRVTEVVAVHVLGVLPVTITV